MVSVAQECLVAIFSLYQRCRSKGSLYTYFALVPSHGEWEWMIDQHCEVHYLQSYLFEDLVNVLNIEKLETW